MPLINVIKLSERLCAIPIEAELKYATADNFMGRCIAGYHPTIINEAYLTEQPAHQLCKVQNYLIDKYNYGLIIYDAYRPKRTAEDMFNWSQLPVSNSYESTRQKIHYPEIEKFQLFKLGYVAEDSNHCYGHTVDVFLKDLVSQQILDMGACFDFFGELAHIKVTADEIGEKAYKNRKILAEAMQRYGFESYEKEFWHFDYSGKLGRENAEPFDIEIADLQLSEIELSLVK